MVQIELDPAAVGRRLHRLGEEPVERERLVIAPREQALEDEVAEQRVAQAARRGEAALQDERVQAVESADHAISDAAAFRSIRIGVGQVVEALRQRRLADHRNAVHGLRRRDLGDEAETERGGERGCDRPPEDEGKNDCGHGAPAVSLRAKANRIVAWCWRRRRHLAGHGKAAGIPCRAGLRMPPAGHHLAVFEGHQPDQGTCRSLAARGIKVEAGTTINA